jgi:hypothetical protein
MKKTAKKFAPHAAAPVAAKTSTAPAVIAPIKPTLTAASAKVSVVPVAPALVKKQTAAAVALITIEAKIDVGFGNKLFVRGQGAGLSWDHGVPLECVDSKTWCLSVPATEKLQFKLLINDSEWAKGEDVVAVPGKRVEVVPAF